MKVKDFFRLTLKLFALYSLVIALFNVLPVALSYFQYDFEWIGWFWVLTEVTLLATLFFWLTFKPDVLIEKLKLESGFENDHIPFEKLDGAAFLKVGAIVIGGIIFLNHLPGFLNNVYLLLKSSVNENSITGIMLGQTPDQTKAQFITNSLNLMIGYLLVSNYGKVANLFSTPSKVD